MTDHRTPHAPSSLLRILGLVFGLAVVVGGMVGSGIMRAPGVVAKGITSPPLILLAWAVGGVFALVSAMPLVEAGASVPMAGGPYPIARRAFGPTVAFLVGWISWLQYVASNAFIAVVFGEYVHRLGMAPSLSTATLGMGLIGAVALINCLGTRFSGTSQSLASAVKGGAFIVLTAILFASPHAPQRIHVGAVGDDHEFPPHEAVRPGRKRRAGEGHGEGRLADLGDVHDEGSGQVAGGDMGRLMRIASGSPRS